MSRVWTNKFRVIVENSGYFWDSKDYSLFFSWCRTSLQLLSSSRQRRLKVNVKKSISSIRLTNLWVFLSRSLKKVSDTLIWSSAMIKSPSLVTVSGVQVPATSVRHALKVSILFLNATYFLIFLSKKFNLLFLQKCIKLKSASFPSVRPSFIT